MLLGLLLLSLLLLPLLLRLLLVKGLLVGEQAARRGVLNEHSPLHGVPAKNTLLLLLHFLCLVLCARCLVLGDGQQHVAVDGVGTVGQQSAACVDFR